MLKVLPPWLRLEDYAAWRDGYRAGHADRLLGIRLDVACIGDGNAYQQEYAAGYYFAQIEELQSLPEAAPLDLPSI